MDGYRFQKKRFQSTMNYQATIEGTARHGYRNLAGVVIVSVGISLAFLPLVGMALIGTPIALLAGLWTTCLLLGVALAVTFRFATTVADRGVSTRVTPAFRAVMGAPMAGLKLGTLTFGVVLGIVAIAVLASVSYPSIAVGVAGFGLVCWYLLVGFAAPELGDATGVAIALRASVVRLVTTPVAAVWFLLLSILCTLLAGVTVLTVVFFLPGTLCFVAAHVTAAVDEAQDPS